MIRFKLYTLVLFHFIIVGFSAQTITIPDDNFVDYLSNYSCLLQHWLDNQLDTSDPQVLSCNIH